MSEKIGTAAGVTSYLKSLKWNGKHNISALARQAAFSGSTQADRVLYSFLTSAVARALEPGCAVNHALVLVGVHGVGKTWLLSELGGKWHRVMHGGKPDPSVWIQNDSWQTHRMWHPRTPRTTCTEMRTRSAP